ncbi:MAG: hypothetical protein Kow006_17280 [Gammaproteobacteria bacterium]
MFDIGFWELSLIFVVALIVLGPERLPRAARTVGLWVGKARQVLSSVKADIDRELKAEELKAMMEKRAAVPELDDLMQEANKTISFDGDAGADAPASAGDKADKPKSSAKPTE